MDSDERLCQVDNPGIDAPKSGQHRLGSNTILQLPASTPSTQGHTSAPSLRPASQVCWSPFLALPLHLHTAYSGVRILWAGFSKRPTFLFPFSQSIDRNSFPPTRTVIHVTSATRATATALTRRNPPIMPFQTSHRSSFLIFFFFSLENVFYSTSHSSKVCEVVRARLRPTGSASRVIIR